MKLAYLVLVTYVPSAVLVRTKPAQVLLRQAVTDEGTDCARWARDPRQASTSSCQCGRAGDDEWWNAMVNAWTTKLYLMSPASAVLPSPPHLYTG